MRGHAKLDRERRMREAGIDPSSPKAWHLYCQLARGRNRANDMRKLGIDPDAPDAEEQYRQGLAEREHAKRERKAAVDRDRRALVDPLYAEERGLRESLFDELEVIDPRRPPAGFLQKFQKWLDAIDRVKETDVDDYSEHRQALERDREAFHIAVGEAVADAWMSEFPRASED